MKYLTLLIAAVVGGAMAKGPKEDVSLMQRLATFVRLPAEQHNALHSPPRPNAWLLSWSVAVVEKKARI